MNKRILQVIAFFIILIPTYLIIYNISILSSDDLMAENVTRLTIAAPGYPIEDYTERDVIKEYIGYIQSASTISEANRILQYESPIEVIFHKSGEELVYRFYLSMNTLECIITAPDNSLLLLSRENAQKMLDSDYSDILYNYSSIPRAYINRTGGVTEQIIPSVCEWFLKKSDGSYKPTSIPMSTVVSNSSRVIQNIPFEFVFEYEPTYLDIVVYNSAGNIIFNNIYSNFNTFRHDADEKLKYVLTAEWERTQTSDYAGKSIYNIDIDYDVPASFDISATAVSAGEVTVITARNINPGESLSLSTDMGFVSSFIDTGTSRIALLPIGMNAQGKTYKASITATDSPIPTEFALKVDTKTYTKKNLGGTTEMMNNNAAPGPIAERNTAYATIFPLTENQKLWDGEFIMPVKGEILLGYGWTVTINNSYPRVNDGVDISAVKGLAVNASNSGKVVYAGKLPDIGNLIVIEHGFGIKTWYGNLDSIGVNVGDTVEKGRDIGKSGSTGLSTNLGARLHFMVSIRDVFINPVQFVDNGVPGF